MPTVVFFKAVLGLLLRILRGCAVPSCVAQNDKLFEKVAFYHIVWSAPRRPELVLAALLWIMALCLVMLFLRILMVFAMMGV